MNAAVVVAVVATVMDAVVATVMDAVVATEVEAVVAAVVESAVHQEFPGFLVRQDIMAHKVHLVGMVEKVLLVPKVQRVTRELVGTKDPQGRWEEIGNSVSIQN